MRNFKVIVSYNGVNFNGYQKQNNLRSVQGEIEKVLNKIHHKDIKSFGAGRTDKGVHALGQVFNFESDLEMNASQFEKAFNSLLPDDIYVKSVEEVDMSFHSRYSSKSKEYRYLVNLGGYNVLEKDYVLQLNKDINDIADWSHLALKFNVLIRSMKDGRHGWVTMGQLVKYDFSQDGLDFNFFNGE